MKRTFSVLSLFILGACAALVPISAPAEPTDEFAALYSERLAWEQENVTNPMTRAIEGASEIAAAGAQINEAAKVPKKNKKRAGEIVDDLWKKYPGAGFLFGVKPPVETNPERVRALLSARFEELKAVGVAQCFNPEKHSFFDSAPCRERLRTACLFCGSDGKGHLMVAAIDEDLQVKELPFDSVEHLKKGFPDYSSTVREEAQLWKLVSLAGVEIRPTWPIDYPMSPKGAAGLPFVGLAPLREQCLEVDIEATRLAVSKVEDRFPDWAESKYSSGTVNWRRNLDNRERACRKEVQSFCENTYVLSNQVILAYRTKGCRVREVTAEDIDADVKEFAETGMTRADQLKHLQLKEEILTCKAAYDHDFRWAYIEPSTKGCKTGDGSRPKSKPAKP